MQLMVYWKHIFFQYLIGTVFLLSGNTIDNILETFNCVNNVESLQNNEGGK